MALGPLRGPGPDLRCVGLRGSRLQAGRKRRAPAKDEPLEPSEQPLPPPLKSEGGGRRSPRRRVRRTQTARKEKPRCRGSSPRRWVGGLEPRQWTCPLRLRSRVPARPRSRVRAFGRPLPSPLGGRPPGGRIVVEAREWLGHGK